LQREGPHCEIRLVEPAVEERCEGELSLIGTHWIHWNFYREWRIRLSGERPYPTRRGGKLQLYLGPGGARHLNACEQGGTGGRKGIRTNAVGNKAGSDHT